MSAPRLAPAAPRTSPGTSITSFDGATIKAHLFPAKGLQTGQRAPTVLVGSGWATPMYPDWLPSAGAISLGPLSFNAELIGPAELSELGYNVLTWANRGWYGSGGEVMVDHPDYEGRDVSALLDWLAAQPEARIDHAGDPRVGMVGVELRRRHPALDRHERPPHRRHRAQHVVELFLDALYPNETIKSGWGNILCGLSGFTLANRSPVLIDLCRSAISGVVTDEEIAYGLEASPGARVAQVTAPTLLLGGTADTLFPLAGNVATYERLRDAGTPVKMMWYCGGHGICDQSTGPAGHVLDVERAFLARYLKGERDDAGLTQPGFEYVDQTGTWRSARSYPRRTAAEVVADGSGWLSLSPEHQSGVFGIMATKADNALTIPIPAPDTTLDLVNAPTLEVTYQGWATLARSPVFAQLIDTTTGKVLGNQTTPMQLTLDGAPHTATMPLSLVSWNVTPSSRLAAADHRQQQPLLRPARGRGGSTWNATLTLPLSKPGRPGQSGPARRVSWAAAR